MADNVLNNQTTTDTRDSATATYTKVAHAWGAVSNTLSDVAQAATNAIVLSLSSVWLSVSAIKAIKNRNNTIEAKRYERKNLYSLKLGEYFMPLSQTFNLRAKKRLNVCSLVDGIDIIQQTRHEAKTIDCSLRITLRGNQPNLEVVSETQSLTDKLFGYLPKNQAEDSSKYSHISTELIRSLETFAHFLTDLYENDAVFIIENQVINEVFGVQYAMISEYNFRPQVGRSTFTFDFSLTEVKITDDTLTVDKTEISSNGTNV